MNNIDYLNSLTQEEINAIVAQSFEEDRQTAEDSNIDPEMLVKDYFESSPEPRFPKRALLSNPGKYKLQEVADELKISKYALTNLINNGNLAIHPGKVFTTTRQDIDELKKRLENYSKNTYTLEDAAKELNISQTILSKYIKQGKIAGKKASDKPNSRYEISFNAIKKFKEERNQSIAIKEAAKELIILENENKKQLKRHTIKPKKILNKNVILSEDLQNAFQPEHNAQNVPLLNKHLPSNPESKEFENFLFDVEQGNPFGTLSEQEIQLALKDFL